MARLSAIISILLLVLLCALPQADAKPKSRSYIDMDAHPTESLKVMINEINVDRGYVELFFRETLTDSTGWQIQWASAGSQGTSVALGCGDNSCQANTFKVFYGFSFHPNHIEVMVTAPASPTGSNNAVVHYVRSSNNANSIKNKQIWSVEDSVATDVFKNGSLTDICAKPDGSALDPDWDRCEPSEGTSNDGGVVPPISVFPRFQHPDSTITCQGAEIGVDLCSNADCSSVDSTNSLVISLSPDSGVTWENLTRGTSGQSLEVWHGDRLQLWAASSGTVTIGAVGQSYLCLSDSGGSSCNIEFKESGIDLSVLLNNAKQSGLTACRNDYDLHLALLETDAANPRRCLPVTSSERVTFSFAYVEPSQPQVEATLAVGSAVLKEGQTKSQSLSFDNNGEATIPIQYDEAGRLNLTATLGRGQGRVTLSGESKLDWLPAGLHITAGDSLCTAGDESCNPLMKAGNSVDVDVTAHCWVANDDGNFGNNPGTLNFRHSGIDLEPELVAPSGGQNSADLPADASGNAVIGNDGSGTVARILDEVGVFRFVPKNDIDYLGHQLAKSSISSANIGRVTPAYLGAETTNTILGAYCNSFSYLGQPVPYTAMPVLTVTGYAIDGSVTNNFDSAFWNLPNPMSSRAYGTQNASVTVQEPSGIAVTEADANDLDGSRRFSVNKSWISFVRPVSPVAPLGTTASGSQTTLSLPSSSFTVSGDQLCLGQWGDCQGSAFTTESGGASLGYIQGPQLRYGRAVLASAYGSENQVVRMPLTLEYFNGQQFATNLLDTGFYGDGRALDSGSPATSGRVTLSGSLNPLPTTSGQAYSLSGVFESLSIAGTGTVTKPPLSLEYHLEHPFASQAGCTFPEAASMAPTWLQWYWDKDHPSVLQNPSAEVTLGRYRGHDKVIYRRELF
ncbi:DUF6701 domain-containing protein [Ferrimonas futtsuensis]|uniref:DUF6701 domain-containing protein n=1 Tax=Ferrimonas futtsuensis TaxID=364764 RepID=UPI0012F8EAD8|nr:DUF6701 domain-containing protein [Ferrimonas futtsuensis]